MNRATYILSFQLINELVGSSTNRPCGWEGKFVEDYYMGQVTEVIEDESEDGELNYPLWFPLVATPAIRKTIDWEYIAEKANDYEYETHIEFMFGDNEDNE